MSESRIRYITNAEYTFKKLQAEMLIHEYTNRVKKALGAKQARELNLLLNQQISSENINIILKTADWKDVLKNMTWVFCNHTLEAQYKYSRKAYKEKLTPEVIKMKCELLGFDEEETEELIKRQLCGRDGRDGRDGRTPDSNPSSSPAST